jgi:hypothetical protein
LRRRHETNELIPAIPRPPHTNTKTNTTAMNRTTTCDTQVVA